MSDPRRDTNPADAEDGRLSEATTEERAVSAMSVEPTPEHEPTPVVARRLRAAADALDDVSDLAPLTVLAEEHGVKLVTMRRWSDKERSNGFPKEVERLGRVKFYRRSEVDRWVTLWRMTGFGGGS